jgi:hypothetical protein
MMQRITTLVLAAVAATALTACQTTTPMETASIDGWNHYGMSGRDSGPTVALGAMAGDESNVITEGTIVDVCPKKGCWMRVVDGDDELFVRFQDYSFFVPMNAAGHRVVMHGTAVTQMMSVEELRHYAEDAGKSPEEIAKITEPTEKVTFFADSVFIEGDDLDPPHRE